MNLYKRLRAVIPEPRLEYGIVAALDDAGVRVQLPGGAIVRVRGQADIGDAVFVRGGAIEGPAPAGLVYTPQDV